MSIEILIIALGHTTVTQVKVYRAERKLIVPIVRRVAIFVRSNRLHGASKLVELCPVPRTTLDCRSVLWLTLCSSVPSYVRHITHMGANKSAPSKLIIDSTKIVHHAMKIFGCGTNCLFFLQDFCQR